MNRKEVLEKIRNGGVVGSGGAGFPSSTKLDAQVEYILVNGAECEPLLYKDRELMIQQRDKLFRGLSIMKEVTGAEKVVIVVKKKNEDVLDEYRSGTQRLGFDLFVIDDVYPAGDEYVIVYEVTGRQIPAGGIPLNVGCIVNNVETITNIADAVDGVPVMDKWITVAGAVENPITTIVPIGVSYQECIDLAGGANVDNPAVLTGGAMMGGVETDLSLPITKTLGGLIVLPEDHYLIQRKSSPKDQYTRVGHGQCDQCSLCTQLCPRYILGYPIEPHQVMRTLLMTGEDKSRISLWAQYCCECNICSLIACPESLDPKNICVDAKANLRENNMSRTAEELTTLMQPAHPIRNGRQVPSSTVMQRLGLTPYNRKAPYIEPILKPSTVNIEINSHIGAPAAPTVTVGDRVRKGDLLADVPAGKLGCPTHASIDGTVTAVHDRSIQLTA